VRWTVGSRVHHLRKNRAAFAVALPGLACACLKDGTRVAIRFLEPADRQVLTDMYGRLGEHSKYQRFFACPTQLPASPSPS